MAKTNDTTVRPRTPATNSTPDPFTRVNQKHLTDPSERQSGYDRNRGSDKPYSGEVFLALFESQPVWIETPPLALEPCALSCNPETGSCALAGSEIFLMVEFSSSVPTVTPLAGEPVWAGGSLVGRIGGINRMLYFVEQPALKL